MPTIFDDLEVPLDQVQTKPGGGYTTKVGTGLDTVDTGKRYREDCPKCRGSGRFTSWGGRDVGPCHKCKGSRDAKDAKGRKLVKAKEGFVQGHADVVEWLTESAPTFPFAASLLGSLDKYGSLTDKQVAAARKCVTRRDESRESAQARADNAPEIDISRVDDAFATAKGNGLKWPKLRLAGFVFSLAGDNSRNPGAIYTKSSDSIYLGKIVGGKFVASRDCDEDTTQEVLRAAQDPEAAAMAYGTMTGSCSCCGRELTNPESVGRGIGPICASKYGW